MNNRISYAFILGFVGFVTSFGAHIVAVNLPVYAKQFGIGIATIGLLIAIYDFAEIFAKPLFGAMADRRGMKKTMLSGIVLFILGSLLYLWINPRLLLLVRFLQGFGAAALSAVSLALIGMYYKENRGRAYGIYNAIKGSGYVISPILGGFIILKTNFSFIFIAAALVGIIAFLVSLTLPDPKNTRKVDIDDDEDELSFKSFISVFKNPLLLRWYAVIVVNMFFVSILFGFLPFRIYSMGYDAFTTGIFLSLISISYLLIQPIAGRLADKMDVVKIIRIGLALSTIGIIFAPFVTGTMLILISVIAGIGIGTVWTNTDNLVSRLSKEGQLGITMGAAGSFKEFGDMIGPVFFGAVSQAFNISVGFVICGILGLISIGLISNKRLWG